MTTRPSSIIHSRRPRDQTLLKSGMSGKEFRRSLARSWFDWRKEHTALCALRFTWCQVYGAVRVDREDT
eukprot:1174117-Prorocentrum_minimum.AAC.4